MDMFSGFFSFFFTPLPFFFLKHIHSVEVKQGLRQCEEHCTTSPTTENCTATHKRIEQINKNKNMKN